MLVYGTNYEEGILVGMTGLPNGEGRTVAKVCYDTMVQCKCKENIRVLVWDTTNSNSGIHKGAAAILERDLPGRKLVWGANKPGAYTKARWMCVCIYTLKMYWYKDQRVLHYTSEFKAKLDRFCRFLVLIYIPYWFKVPLSADAAVTDLAMYHLLLKYSAIDFEVSHGALTAQGRHLWYLSPDSIILWSLFGSSLSEDEKSGIATVLLSKTKPENFEAKKVQFPILTHATKIKHLITPMSWFPFTLLGLQDSWLRLPPAQWELMLIIWR